jgi:hypothetical protein
VGGPTWGRPGAKVAGALQTSDFESEVAPEIAAGRALGFTAHDDLRAQRLASLPPR